MWYPWVIGYRRSPMLTYNFWKYIDIDLTREPDRAELR